jgi:hypothetical protein
VRLSFSDLEQVEPERLDLGQHAVQCGLVSCAIRRLVAGSGLVIGRG